MIRNLLKNHVSKVKRMAHGELAREKALEYGIPGDQILDFSTNVNSLGPPASVMNSIRENLNVISRYPPNEPKELRGELAEYSKSSPEKIVIGNGSTELIYLLTKIFLDINDEVIIAEPTFTEYRKAVKVQGGKIRSIRLRKEEDYRLEPDSIQERISQDTKLVFLCSPNNPTGRMIPIDALKGVVETCEDYEALVVLDEAFYEYCDHPQKYNVAEMKFNNLISIRSLTKFYALAGLRIGYVIAPTPLAKVMREVKVQWNVNFLAQIAAKEAVKDFEFAARTKEQTKKGKNFLWKELKKFGGLKTYPSHANFFLINLSNSNISSNELVEGLLMRGITIRDCSNFKFLDGNFVRACARPLEDCKKLIECMNEINSKGDLDGNKA